MKIRKAQRIEALPPYPFAEIDRKKKELASRGADLISLGIGDPDLPTPPHVVERLCQAARDPANHRYPDYEGLLAFRRAAAEWYRRRFGVELDPETEVVSLIGSKEGIAHFPLAFVDPGDIVLCPDPGYPVYSVGTLFAGGTPYPMPLRKQNDFFPDLSEIPPEVARRARMMWLCYPNNPTAVTATRERFAEAVEFAHRYGLIVCHDAAYSEIYYDDPPPLSFLAVEGAKEVAIEFHSLSKTFNMTGWRVGFAVGHRELVAGLGQVKTNVDSGVFQAVQEAAIAALGGDPSPVERNRQIYRRRRDLLLGALEGVGLRFVRPQATFYVWVENPPGYSSVEFAAKILEETAVVVTPGTAFGRYGEGYVRFALTVGEDRLREAVRRIATLRL